MTVIRIAATVEAHSYINAVLPQHIKKRLVKEHSVSLESEIDIAIGRNGPAHLTNELDKKFWAGDKRLTTVEDDAGLGEIMFS